MYLLILQIKILLKKKSNYLKKNKSNLFKMKENPQSILLYVKLLKTRNFFKYVNKFKTTLSSPSILIDKNNKIITDPTKIANNLQDHFKSVYSNPNLNLNEIINFDKPEILYPLPDFEVSTDDVIKAIDKMKLFSACPKNNIPSIVFKKCKFTICRPLQLFFQKSFLLGIVPSAYKFNQVTPLHKKGPKTDSSNFRPIVLTPHEIKICERILRSKLVIYFESNKIFNSSQHGFRNNRSCLTQLLVHTQNIINDLVSNNSVDTFYIDYAKAFDKVDHLILLKKLEHYGVTDRYLIWIKSFLSGRKQVVNINNVFSYEADVTSGVPQGSVLSTLFFIIFSNDLQNNITHSNILAFADDTKLILPINSTLDTLHLQEDINSIISWSDTNNMKLNKNKFELITHNID